MSQAERMNSASNAWEADPWNASDQIADVQLAGFRERITKPVDWTSIRKGDGSVFGIAKDKLIGGDVEFYATHDGEDMLLMQFASAQFPRSLRLGTYVVNWHAVSVDTHRISGKVTFTVR